MIFKIKTFLVQRFLSKFDFLYVPSIILNINAYNSLKYINSWFLNSFDLLIARKYQYLNYLNFNPQFLIKQLIPIFISFLKITCPKITLKIFKHLILTIFDSISKTQKLSQRTIYFQTPKNFTIRLNYLLSKNTK